MDMEVNPDVYAYELDWPKCTKYAGAQEPLWVHVIETGEASVLFGTGDETTKDELLPIARDHDVDQVVVEHGDPDHWEGVPFLRDELDVQVSIPAGDAERMIEAGIQPDKRLEAGQTYWGIETLAAPGHTPDNMGYLYEDALVAGDIVFGVDSVYTLEYEYSGELGIVTPDWNSDDDAMRQSVRDLAAVDFDCVLVTHGSSVHSGGHEEWEKLVADLDAMG
jgi:glyoxylase-like metal-dependent hydrolase (beta-lactamase superfamily II)